MDIVQKSLALMITVLAASALVASGFALLTIQKTIPSSGSIKGVGVGVYWNQQCTDVTSSVDFGLLEAGSQKDFTSQEKDPVQKFKIQESYEYHFIHFAIGKQQHSIMKQKIHYMSKSFWDIKNWTQPCCIFK
jgi:hypothetical protein